MLKSICPIKYGQFLFAGLELTKFSLDLVLVGKDIIRRATIFDYKQDEGIITYSYNATRKYSISEIKLGLALRGRKIFYCDSYGSFAFMDPNHKFVRIYDIADDEISLKYVIKDTFDSIVYYENGIIYLQNGKDILGFDIETERTEKIKDRVGINPFDPCISIGFDKDRVLFYDNNEILSKGKGQILKFVDENTALIYQNMTGFWIHFNYRTRKIIQSNTKPFYVIDGKIHNVRENHYFSDGYILGDNYEVQELK